MITSIESLPNEIWLTFMSYLGAIDMFRAFSRLNCRINSLLTDTSQSDCNVIHFSDMCQFMEGNYLWSKHLRLSIDTIRLCGTGVGYEVVRYMSRKQ